MKSNNLQNIPAALVNVIWMQCYIYDPYVNVWLYGFINWTHFMYPHYSENFKMRQKYEKNTSKWTVIEYMDILDSYLCKPIWYKKKKKSKYFYNYRHVYILHVLTLYNKM